MEKNKKKKTKFTWTSERFNDPTNGQANKKVGYDMDWNESAKLCENGMFLFQSAPLLSTRYSVGWLNNNFSTYQFYLKEPSIYCRIASMQREYEKRRRKKKKTVREVPVQEKVGSITIIKCAHTSYSTDWTNEITGTHCLATTSYYFELSYNNRK